MSIFLSISHHEYYCKCYHFPTITITNYHCPLLNSKLASNLLAPYSGPQHMAINLMALLANTMAHTLAQPLQLFPIYRLSSFTSLWLPQPTHSLVHILT